MRNLYYFVFTSGEEGVHGTDWGIKFSSKILGDAVSLDVNYRDLLKKFGLSPNLKRPDKDNDVGLLLLPNNSGKLLIFIIPGRDLKERLNTIAIACNIPIDLTFSFNVREVARRIWSANDLMKISGRNSFRPDTLLFPDEPAPAVEYPFVASSGLMQWPENNGYLSINRNIRELSIVSTKVKTNDEPVIVRSIDKPLWPKILVASAIGIVFCVGFYAVSEILKTDEETIIVEELTKIPPQTQTKSPDLPPQSKAPIVLQIESSDAQRTQQADNSSKEKEIEIEKNNLREVLKSLNPTKEGAGIQFDDNKGNKFLFFEIENYNENEKNEFFSKIVNDKVRSHISIEPHNLKPELYTVRFDFWHDDEKLKKGSQLKKGSIDFNMAVEIFINQAMEAK